MSLRTKIGNSLVVQWLGLHASIAGGPGLIPGQETRIPQALWCGKKKKFCCCFFKDKRYVSERSKHLSENVLILNLHWECPSCERSCQGYVRRTHRTPAPPTPDQGWGKGLLMKISPWVGASNVFKEKNPGFVLMIRGKEKTRECPSESVRESTHLEKLVE